MLAWNWVLTHFWLTLGARKRVCWMLFMKRWRPSSQRSRPRCDILTFSFCVLTELSSYSFKDVCLSQQTLCLACRWIPQKLPQFFFFFFLTMSPDTSGVSHSQMFAPPYKSISSNLTSPSRHVDDQKKIFFKIPILAPRHNRLLCLHAAKNRIQKCSMQKKATRIPCMVRANGPLWSHIKIKKHAVITQAVAGPRRQSIKYVLIVAGAAAEHHRRCQASTCARGEEWTRDWGHRKEQHGRSP